METIFYPILWIFGASLLGFGITAVFSSWLNLPRKFFLVPYVGLTSGFLYWFFMANQISLTGLIAENWVAGLLVGLLASVFLVKNVRSQPATREASGGELAANIAWLGLVYGIVDALFLNVMPVLAVKVGFEQLSLAEGVLSQIGFGALALVASLLVTAAYHAGYSEFRNRRMVLVLLGNTVITLAYFLSTNPLAAILSHTVMHIAATLQGPETTIQLPPHDKEFLAETYLRTKLNQNE